MAVVMLCTRCSILHFAGDPCPKMTPVPRINNLSTTTIATLAVAAAVFVAVVAIVLVVSLGVAE